MGNKYDATAAMTIAVTTKANKVFRCNFVSPHRHENCYDR